jgi:chromosome segregation ATPase
MAGTPGTQIACGIEIPADQRTPLVEALLRVIDRLEATNEELRRTNEQLRTTIAQQQLRIEQLEDEVRRLKGLPEKPKRKPSPSPLNDPSGPPSTASEKKKKRHGSKTHVFG